MKKLSCLLALFFLSIPLRSEWNLIWDESWVSSYSQVNGVIFMGSGHGLQRSIDNGATWISSHVGLPNNNPEMFAFCNGVYFAAISKFGIYKSLDSGATWEISSSQLTNATNLFSKNNKIYLSKLDFSGTSVNGIFMSGDSGGTWIEISSNIGHGGQDKDIWGAAFNDDYLIVAAEGGVFKTNDDGANWINISEGKDIDYIDARALAVFNDAIYWSTSSKIYKSTNKGDTWIEAYYRNAWSYAQSENILFARNFEMSFLNKETNSWTSNSQELERLNLTMDSIYGIGAIGNKLYMGARCGLYELVVPSSINRVENNFQNKLSLTYNTALKILEVNNPDDHPKEITIFSFLALNLKNLR